MVRGKPFAQRQVIQKEDLAASEGVLWAEVRALRQHVDDLDRLYQERFEAQREAITKAETAQAEYNERSNEFRGQLDDQAKTLMPRTESLANWKSAQNAIDNVEKNMQLAIDRNSTDIRFLREGGGTALTKGVKDEARANVSLIIALAFGGLGAIVGVISVGLLLLRYFGGR